MVKATLTVFDLLSRLFTLMGINYPQFRAILEIKLTMDGRRRMGGIQHGPGKGKSNQFALSLLVYAFLGTFVGLFLLMADSPLVGMTIVNVFIMIMIATSLIADYTSVLFDTTDNQVLRPRPVDDRTALAARVAHIATYLTLLTLSLSGGTFVVGTIHYHYLFPLVFLVTVILSIVLVMFGVQVFYLLALRLTNPDRFRDIIVYFQIFVMAVVFGGYQLLPRLIGAQQLEGVVIVDKWWIYLFPPTWMAGPAALLTGQTGAPQIALSTLALVVPLIALVFTVRVLAPNFSSLVAAMEGSSQHTKWYVKNDDQRRRGWGSNLARLISRRPHQQAAFEFLWKVAFRDRQFKLRTYPSVAILLIIGAVFLINDPEGWQHAWRNLPDSHKHLWIMYLSCMMVPTSVMHMRYSNNCEAAWIYQALPLIRPGDVFAAALKVILIRFVLPVFAVISLAILLIWGLRALPDVALGFSATLLISSLQALVFGRAFPFSEVFNPKDSSGRIVKAMFLMFFPLGLGLIHFVISRWAWSGAVLLACIPALLAAALVMNRHANTGWEKVSS